MAVIIDGGDNNPLSRDSHVVLARRIAERFVEHMSGVLSVEGLRESMTQLSAPETRLMMGSGYQQQHLDRQHNVLGEALLSSGSYRCTDDLFKTFEGRRDRLDDLGRWEALHKVKTCPALCLVVCCG